MVYYNFIELIRICTPTISVGFANYDLPLLSQLDITTTCYNYASIWRILLENIGGKTLLYIGNAVKSIEYAKSVGLNNIWKFHVDDFNLKCVKTPQTTSGSRNFPHNNMIETTENILDEIENIGHFDCVILGCGVYGAPLINELRKRYTNTNIVYLGSDCFKMFGILTPKMRWDLSQEETKRLVEISNFLTIHIVITIKIIVYGCKKTQKIIIILSQILEIK